MHHDGALSYLSEATEALMDDAEQNKEDDKLVTIAVDGGAGARWQLPQLRVRAGEETVKRYTEWWTSDAQTQEIYSRERGMQCSPEEMNYVLQVLSNKQLPAVQLRAEAAEAIASLETRRNDLPLILTGVERVQDINALERFLLFMQQHPGAVTDTMHGTSAKCAQEIVRNGFMTVAANRGLLGRGTYSTTSLSVALQYSTPPKRAAGLEMQDAIAAASQSMPTEQTLLLTVVARGDAECVGAQNKVLQVNKEQKMVMLYKSPDESVLVALKQEQIMPRYRVKVLCNIAGMRQWKMVHVDLYKEVLQSVLVTRWRLKRLIDMKIAAVERLCGSASGKCVEEKMLENLSSWVASREMLDNMFEDMGDQRISTHTVKEEWASVKSFFDAHQRWIDEQTRISTAALSGICSSASANLVKANGVCVQLPEEAEARARLDEIGRRWESVRLAKAGMVLVAADAPAAGAPAAGAPAAIVPPVAMKLSDVLRQESEAAKHARYLANSTTLQLSGRRVGELVCLENMYMGLEDLNGMTGVLRQIVTTRVNTPVFVVDVEDLSSLQQKAAQYNQTSRRKLRDKIGDMYDGPHCIGWDEKTRTPKANYVGLSLNMLSCKRQTGSLDWMVDKIAGGVRAASLPAVRSSVQVDGVWQEVPYVGDGSLVQFGSMCRMYGKPSNSELVRRLHGRHARVYAILRRHREKNNSPECLLVLVAPFEVECEDSKLVSEVIKTCDRSCMSEADRTWVQSMETSFKPHRMLCCAATDLLPVLDPMPYKFWHGRGEMQLDDPPPLEQSPKKSCKEQADVSLVAMMQKGDKIRVRDTWVTMEALKGLTGTIVAAKYTKIHASHAKLQDHARRYLMFVLLDGPLTDKQRAALTGEVAQAVNGAYKTFVHYESAAAARLLGVEQLPHPLLLCDGVLHVVPRVLHGGAAGGAAGKKRKSRD